MGELAVSSASVPLGHRVYAIGDIHGCLSKLDALHGLIADDLACRPVASPVLIHIGDYVDRGCDSAGVLARLSTGPPVAGLQVVNLLGNHEYTMLEALNGDRAAGTDWLYQGGRATLESYGVDPDGPRVDWAAAIPEGHISWMRSLTPWHQVGGYLFVHAGIRPGVRLEEQALEDLLRIRQPFLYTVQDLGYVVVHGHTPARSVAVQPNRINVDTGAVFGGKLSCLVLEGSSVDVLQV